jgi:hypothetical protein
MRAWVWDYLRCLIQELKGASGLLAKTISEKHTFSWILEQSKNDSHWCSPNESSCGPFCAEASIESVLIGLRTRHGRHWLIVEYKLMSLNNTRHCRRVVMAYCLYHCCWELGVGSRDWSPLSVGWSLATGFSTACFSLVSTPCSWRSVTIHPNVHPSSVVMSFHHPSSMSVHHPLP